MNYSINKKIKIILLSIITSFGNNIKNGDLNKWTKFLHEFSDHVNFNHDDMKNIINQIINTWENISCDYPLVGKMLEEFNNNF